MLSPVERMVLSRPRIRRLLLVLCPRCRRRLRGIFPVKEKV